MVHCMSTFAFFSSVKWGFQSLLVGFVCHFKCSVVKGPDAAEGPTGAAGLVFDRQRTADAAQNGTP